MTMDRIFTQKKPDSVAAAIRDAILSGSIPGEEELTQNELAESLGVSRMPVREALLALEYQGLVIRLPNNHVKVAVIEKSYLQDIFERCAQEEQLLLDGLQNDAAKLTNALASPSPEAEQYFHRFLSRRQQNAFLRKQLETMVEIYVAYALRSSSHDSISACRILSEAVSKRSAKAITDYYSFLIDSIPDA